MPITKARARAGMDLYVDDAVTCPAGHFIGITPYGSACLCKLLARDHLGKHDRRARSDEVVTTSFDPAALESFCMGEYQACPIWQAERERVAEGRREPLVSPT